MTNSNSADRPQVIGSGRISSFSQGNQCVEVFETTDPNILAIGHSKDLSQGRTYFTKPEIAAFLKGAQAGEFDDLV